MFRDSDFSESISKIELLGGLYLDLLQTGLNFD